MRLVIMGGVAGGATAAARARRLDEGIEIVLIERGPYISFANCGLPYHIGGEIERREALLLNTPEGFSRRFNLDLRIRSEVIRIDRAEKTVIVRDIERGEEYPLAYDRLILSPGASPIVPPLPGIGLDGIFTLRDIPDTDRIRDFIEEYRPGRAVVVGAGYIGIEMAEAFRGRGIETRIVELLPRILPVFDPEMALLAREEITKNGLVVTTGTKVTGFEGRERVERVTVEDGDPIDADIVLLSIGVRPDTEIARSAGIEIDEKGRIVTGPDCGTSDPEIFAVGDAALVPRAPGGGMAWMALAGPANRAARVAAGNAVLGAGERLYPQTGSAVLRIFSKTAAMTGLSLLAAREAGITGARGAYVVAPDHASYFPGAERMILKVVFDSADGRILGAQAVGGPGVVKRIDLVSAAIAMGGSYRDLAGFHSAYSPPYASARDPVNMAGMIMENHISGLSPLVDPGDVVSGREEGRILDVRTPREVAGGAIEGSIRIPLDELRERLDELDPSERHLVHCAAGYRSHIAVRILKGRGFGEVSNISGGYAVLRLFEGLIK